jgi:hypothetical protein
MKDNVFDPLGMNNTIIEMETEQVIPGAADSYRDAETEGYITDFSNRAYYGAADIYTTAGDIAKWLNNFKEASVGGKELIDEMTTPYPLTSGDTSDYALGISVRDFRGLKKFSHTGAHAGYRAYLSYFPELDAGVYFVQNYSPIPLLTGPAVEDIFLGDELEPREEENERVSLNKEEDQVQISNSLLESYEGTYREVSGQPAFEMTKTEDGLQMHLGEDKLPLFATADTIFGGEKIPFKVVFTPDEKGEVTKGYVNAGQKYHFTRIEDFDYSLENLKTYTGTYFSPELESFQKIKMEDDRLVVLSPREEPAPIKGYEKDSFDALRDNFTIRFKRDEAGELEGFYISQGRTRNIWFEKEENK